MLTPARLAVAAALGLTDLDLFARPRVAILSTGDEIVAPGGRLGPGQIFDSNTTALAAAVAAHGGEPVTQPRTRDDRDALTRAFQVAAREDLVLFCGGSSVGERDYSLEILESLGTVHFEGLQLKPGKPTIFATVNGVPVFGLPGNPVSCLTNMYLFVAPMLRRMARLPPPDPAGRPGASCGTRHVAGVDATRSTPCASRPGGGAGLQELGRDHEPRPRRRVLRDCRRRREPRRRRAGPGRLVLNRGQCRSEM